jgi:hypothetical protein
MKKPCSKVLSVSISKHSLSKMLYSKPFRFGEIFGKNSLKDSVCDFLVFMM